MLVGLVAAGGAVGGPGRYAVAQLLLREAAGFPWATLSVNLVGAALLGFVLVVLTERGRPADRLRAFLGTGVCGAFTTFSTFGVETDQLVRNGAARRPPPT
ncbi:MAG: CrcB family protein [Acidimicrobiales bacterium]